MAALLKQIPANSIENVELITNPSSKYDPDGMAGIINIVLKKNKLIGTKGTISLSAATGEKYNGTATLNCRSGKWNAFATLGYRTHMNSY